ncbi:hypothetical protein FHW96_001074 [Novosphingobium sp. SG751A]|uniref:hypothetical protein n=1 Tax=Novosphingobium sp. SG751A TaxID=2587000 RepID=UPI001552E402|nr:hypothetical protein [Novosphingobium sp. SG751A]NOW44928.1 hypothetical protein [Novosphingobium sp. SG751A]
MKHLLLIGIGLSAFTSSIASAASFCNLDGYQRADGLIAESDNEGLTVTWDGAKDETLRLRLSLKNGVPTLEEIGARAGEGPWAVVARNLVPSFRVVSGYRRMEGRNAGGQFGALRRLGVPIMPETVKQYKWDAFWDAPLMIPGTEDGGHADARPPLEPMAGQRGLPRTADEIKRADIAFGMTGCEVNTNGGSIEISLPGITLGVFEGRLQYTVYKGTNLIRQEVVAKTDEDSVAYKYEAGLKGLPIEDRSRVTWRSTANTPQAYALDGLPNTAPVTLQAANRLVVADLEGGAIAAFPPPHNFFWAREISYNLGYAWYSKDSASSFSFGVRQADTEVDPANAGRGPMDYRENFALRSARPGTWQRMPVYFYVSGKGASDASEGALAFTRGDRFKALDGYKVMATHFHAAITTRLLQTGNLNNILPDFEVAKDAGINIFAPIDDDGQNGSHGAALPGAGHVKNQALYYEVARRHSSKDFLIMPNEEIMMGEDLDLAKAIGGHTDLFMSHPVYWNPTRKSGQSLVETDATYGKVYNIGSPDDLTEMMKRENLLIYMPHPRTKGSTGFPDAIKDRAYFLDETFRGIGFRWGMGIDGSETRLCELRCLPTLDDMNNWIADTPTPPKFIQAISELYAQGPGDDVYANNPVNYVKLDTLPGPDNWKPIVDALRSGDYFVTSGEVLVPHYAVEGTGRRRTIVADLEWTFPLDFVEVVWGDGRKTNRQIISTRDLPPFGVHRFEIPFDTTGKKWVRFAAWDTAGNGAMVQPIKVTGKAFGRTVRR